MNIQDLTRFGMMRTPFEVLLFYIGYIIFGFLVIVGINLMVIPFLDLDMANASALSENLGRSVAIIVSSGLALFIVLAKDLHKSAVYLALILAAAVFAVWGGLYLGLLVPAFLTLVPRAGIHEAERKHANVPAVRTMNPPMVAEAKTAVSAPLGKEEKKPEVKREKQQGRRTEEKHAANTSPEKRDTKAGVAKAVSEEAKKPKAKPAEKNEERSEGGPATEPRDMPKEKLASNVRLEDPSLF